MRSDKYERFRQLHIKGRPVTLYNIWDAGSAKAVASAGASALATGSWSMAAAQGYADGEAIPLALVVTIVARITATVDLPLSVDFESGYATAPEDIAANVLRIVEAGAVGINFEDGIPGGTGLFEISRQTESIAAIKATVGTQADGLFINARTDLFLQESDAAKHAGLVDATIERGLAYTAAGADGFFVPGLVEERLIEQIAKAVPLPLNVMVKSGLPAAELLSSIGVARVSHGPGPYLDAMTHLSDMAHAVYG